jgi:hypothetical protein
LKIYRVQLTHATDELLLVCDKVALEVGEIKVGSKRGSLCHLRSPR